MKVINVPSPSSDSLCRTRDLLVSRLREHAVPLEEMISARPLGVVEAIGNPSDFKDFPLQQGVEKLLEVTYRSSRGQAFTSEPCFWTGTLEEVWSLDLGTQKGRALLLATINAVADHLDLTEKTIHCRDQEPNECGKIMAGKILDDFGRDCVVGIAGYNPAIVKHIVDALGPEHVRLTDLNSSNLGDTKFGVPVWHGLRDLDRLSNDCDVALVTGSALANGTFDSVREKLEEAGKPCIFFGTSVAAVASLMGYRRWCFPAA